MIRSHRFSFPEQPLPLQESEPVAQFEIGSMQNFVYLILDWKSRCAAIIDPQKDLSLPLGALDRYGFELTHILLTHTHHDHVAGVPELLDLKPNARLAVHRDDAHRLRITPKYKTRITHLIDGDRVQIGELKIEALHTPGHSAGELCYFLNGTSPVLFSGDTLFIRDCGRTDLPTGSTAQMYESLQKLKTLPGETVLLPGHHYARECFSTLSQEWRESPPLQCRNLEELEALP